MRELRNFLGSQLGLFSCLRRQKFLRLSNQTPHNSYKSTMPTSTRRANNLDEIRRASHAN